MAIMTIEPVKGLTIEEIVGAFRLLNKNDEPIGWFQRRHEAEYVQQLLEQGAMRVSEVSIQQGGYILATVNDLNFEDCRCIMMLSCGEVKDVVLIKRG